MILHLALFPVTWLYYRWVAYREARRAARGENTTEEEVVYDVDGSRVSLTYLLAFAPIVVSIVVHTYLFVFMSMNMYGGGIL